jgi:predicted RNase H-like HicB family nuclease
MTTVSSLIKVLQENLEKFGDMPVAVYTSGGFKSTCISPEVLPPHYDGGFIYAEENKGFHRQHWIRSRTKPPAKLFFLLHADYPCEDEDTIDGLAIETGQLVFDVSVVIESDGEGFHGFCPALKGVHTSGETVDDTLKHLKDAVSAYIQSCLLHRDPLTIGILDPTTDVESTNYSERYEEFRDPFTGEQLFRRLSTTTKTIVKGIRVNVSYEV